MDLAVDAVQVERLVALLELGLRAFPVHRVVMEVELVVERGEGVFGVRDVDFDVVVLVIGRRLFDERQVDAALEEEGVRAALALRLGEVEVDVAADLHALHFARVLVDVHRAALGDAARKGEGRLLVFDDVGNRIHEGREPCSSRSKRSWPAVLPASSRGGRPF